MFSVLVYCLNSNDMGLFPSYFHLISIFSPVISCIGEGTTEWQRFECSNMFIRVPRVTVQNFHKFPIEENMLQQF